jgi:hypothetical protein
MGAKATMAFDTKPSIQALQDDIIRRMSGQDRLRLAMDMSDAARMLAFARLSRKYPNAPSEQLVREFLHTILSPDEIPAVFR